MDQISAPHSLSAHDAEHSELDWPPLSPEAVRWMIIVGGAVFAAAVGALLGGVMSL